MGQNKKDSLGDRMKTCYEDPYRVMLPRRIPLILRLDGKSFHSYTKSFQKPFDEILKKGFEESCIELLREISGAKIAYSQSDEVSVLITDYDEYTTQPWFDKNLQKIVSVAASIITATFNDLIRTLKPEISKRALFDARIIILQKEEVNNYFLWRQNDASRNSVSSLAQSKFSHKELHKKNTFDMMEMLFQQHKINWNCLPTWQKRGFCVFRSSNIEPNGIRRTKIISDMEIPTFSQNVNYINKFVYLNENFEENIIKC